MSLRQTKQEFLEQLKNDFYESLDNKLAEKPITIEEASEIKNLIREVFGMVATENEDNEKSRLIMVLQSFKALKRTGGVMDKKIINLAQRIVRVLPGSERHWLISKNQRDGIRFESALLVVDINEKTNEPQSDEFDDKDHD